MLYAIIRKRGYSALYVQFFIKVIIPLMLITCTASTASLVGAAYWLISYVPAAYLNRNIDVIPLGWKYLCCLSPNTGLMIGFQIIGLAELNSDGVRWGILFSEEFDLGHVIVIFLANTFIRILFAVYFEHLFPTTNQFGFRIPWCYFFTVNYRKNNCVRIMKQNQTLIF